MSERTVLVTGGSNGIGRAILERLVADGFHTLNLDITSPSQALAGSEYHHIDLTDVASIDKLLPELSRQHHITRLVNNAGIICPATLEDTDLETFRRVSALNLEAPLRLTQHLLPTMKAARFGRIVSVSSRAALGKPLRSAYAASKAGILGLTRTWALELAQYGITVNAIGPGPIATELFMESNPADSDRTRRLMDTIPLQRLGQPADVAHGVASLLDDRAGFITGQTLYICGGMTVGLV